MKDRFRFLPEKYLLILAALALILCGVLWEYLPSGGIRFLVLISGVLIFLLAFLWGRRQKKEQTDFANDICDTVDYLMNGCDPENYQPYEDSQISKVQGKLLQYYDRMQEGRRQSEQDKQTIQELVSDISHQVKTPIANIRMFTNILQQHSLTAEKRTEFLDTMTAQENSLYNTIARAVNSIWAKADQKQIRIDVECDSHAAVKHDTRWTAEALDNILDNAVKYTPEGGSISIRVRPWQFYTRIDITDTGIGIAAAHYNDVFQRFYRAQEVSAEEGVGLGLYLARGIITRQKGYISVKSEVGEGTTFSVFLLQ